jgi:hypothetical protein
MTKVIYNGSIQAFSGRIGNLIFRQLPDGTTVVSSAPPEETRKQKKRAKLKRSANQQAHNSCFAQAAAYATIAAKAEPIYAELAAAETTKTAYNFALSDWFHAPVIHRLEQREGRVRVKASDNVQVTKVKVTLLDADGRVMETGEAFRSEGECWEFASLVEGKTILAEAWDLPGHVARAAVQSTPTSQPRKARAK